MGTISYAYPDFTAYTKIKSAEVNSKFTTLRTLVNGNIDNANIASGAAIAYSKLNLAGSIVNADINASAAIAYSKLNLANSVNLSTDTAATALPATKGGTAQTTYTTGDTLYASASNTLSKLSIGSSGQVLTVSGGAPSWATPAFAPSAFYEISNTSITATVAANALTIALKDGSGSDPSSGSPAKIGFRSSTVTSGAYNQRSVTSALSIVVPSGTTIGTANGVASYIYVYALDNAGTVELAVSLAQYSFLSVQSTSAISGGSSASTVYSTTSRSSVPIRLIGRVLISEATAGTWASAPTEVSLGSDWDTPTIAAHVYTPTLTVGTSRAAVIFGAKLYDTVGAYNTGTGAFTVPSGWAGKYRVTVRLLSNGAVSSSLADRGSYVYLGKNSSTAGTKAIATYSYQVSGVSLTQNFAGSTEIDCVAGDTLYITMMRDSQVSSFSLYNGDAIESWATFTRVGN